MSYVVESGSSLRARRRRRTAITLLIVVALLAGAFYYASRYFRTGGKVTAGPCVTSTSTAVPGLPTPSQITVNIYNATRRTGLATATAKVVRDRGFIVGTVANDTSKKAVPQPAEVRYGVSGQAAAQVVMTLVAGAVPLNDSRADGSVDLVLGDGFKEIAPPGTVPLTSPTPAPTPAPSAGSKPPAPPASTTKPPASQSTSKPPAAAPPTTTAPAAVPSTPAASAVATGAPC